MIILVRGLELPFKLPISLYSAYGCVFTLFVVIILIQIS
jgi:hypothetical protein